MMSLDELLEMPKEDFEKKPEILWGVIAGIHKDAERGYYISKVLEFNLKENMYTYEEEKIIRKAPGPGWFKFSKDDDKTSQHPEFDEWETSLVILCRSKDAAHALGFGFTLGAQALSDFIRLKVKQ